MVVKNKKIKIHTNNSCNLKCRFCYYGDSSCIKEKDPSLEDLKIQIKKAKELGAMDVDFCGGEPTIMPDFVELVKYTKSLGYRTIGLTTNGLRMSNKDYAKKVIDAGLNDVLFSLEGYNAKTHDYLTQVPGSFDKITKAMKNVKSLKVTLRVNTTVTNDNYQVLDKFAKLLLKIKPNSVNFIKFNPWGEALNASKELFPKYSDMAPHIKKAIDILSPHVDKISVRYMAFCFMQGYEKHVSNVTNLIYDQDEWGLHGVQVKMSKKFPKYHISLIKKIIKNIPYLIKIKPTLSADKIIQDLTIKKLYIKLPQCKKCKYYLICDGVDRTYTKFHSSEDIVPVIGERIIDPMYFRASYLDNYEKKHPLKFCNSCT